MPSGKGQSGRGGTGHSEQALVETVSSRARGATEGFVDYIRAKREVRHALVISDPLPVDSVRNVWTSAGQAATIGIFLLLFGAFLYIGHAILLPILAAAIVALTLAPLIKAAAARGISPWISGIFILAVGLGALSLIVTALAGPVSEWIGRAPEIGSTIKDKLAVLDRPLASLHELQTALSGGEGVNVNTPPTSLVLPVVAFVTPAAGELLLFFGTLLFFLIGQIELRTSLVSLFGNRDTKLRFLKIMRDIERNLAGYLTVVTIINAALGTVVAVGTWLVGYPNPVIFGVLAALLNYVPYVGPGVMVIALFGVGLVSFDSIAHAAIAPLGFIALTALEGHLITPTIVGRRLTLNPLVVLLALAFWTWMWGPFGAFLAVPLSIIGLVVFNHLFPTEEVNLPD
jgi:predicted PurR-regulated permease PerM